MGQQEVVLTPNHWAEVFIKSVNGQMNTNTMNVVLNLN